MSDTSKNTKHTKKTAAVLTRTKALELHLKDIFHDPVKLFRK